MWRDSNRQDTSYKFIIRKKFILRNRNEKCAEREVCRTRSMHIRLTEETNTWPRLLFNIATVTLRKHVTIAYTIIFHAWYLSTDFDGVMEQSTPFHYCRAYKLRAPEVHEYAHIKYGTLRFLRRRRKLADLSDRTQR